MDNFKNPYPEEFGFLRIGTPICADTNEIYYFRPAFDMGMLQKANFLIQNFNTTSEKHIMGGGMDSKSQKAWGFSVAADLGIKTGFVDVGLSFHLDQQQNVCTASSSQHISAFAKATGKIVLLDNITEDDLLSCATKDFREKMINLRNASNDKQLSEALIDFYLHYGTGFVCSLELGNLGIFVGKASYASSSVEKKFNTGGSASVSFVVGSGSVAADYSEKNMDANAGGNFDASSFCMPEGCSSGQWVDGFLNSFAGASIGKLGNLDAWSSAFDQKIAEVDKVDIKEKEPDKSPLPEYETKDFNDAISKMKIQRFEDDYRKKHNGQYPPVDEYEKYQKELAGKANRTEDQINDPTKNLEMNDENSNENLLSDWIKSKSNNNIKSIKKVSDNSDGTGLTLGGYGITGYNYTPWSKYFPMLEKLEEKITSSQFGVGYVAAWMAIQWNISQYFTFCGQYEDIEKPENSIAPYGMEVNAKCFQNALSKMSDDLKKAGSWIRDENIESKLQTSLRKYLIDEGFMMYEHYSFVKKNYNMLKRIPFGVVPLFLLDDIHWYSCASENKLKRMFNKPCWNSAPRLVSDNAIRLYPVLAERNDKIFFFWAGSVNYKNGSDIVLGTPTLQNFITNIDTTFDAAQKGGMLSYQKPRSQARYNITSPDESIVTVDQESLDVWLWSLNAGNKPVLGYELRTDNSDTVVHCLIGDNNCFSILLERWKQKETLRKIRPGNIYFVPISYRDVEQAGGKIESGGLPMFCEPASNSFVTKLNELAEDVLHAEEI